MEKHELDELIACLPTGRTRYYYTPGQYIPFILATLVRRGRLQTLADLKQSPYAKWQQHPWLKGYIASLPNAKSSLDGLSDRLLDGPVTPYTLSVGRWGHAKGSRWYQTSRRGENLVLHMNLPMHYIRDLQALGIHNPCDEQWWCHPRDGRRLTLGWARVDIDFAHGQVLIEEVQNDLLRDLSDALKDARAALDPAATVYLMGERVNASKLRRLCEAWIQQMCQVWADALLYMTLQFIINELGIYDVYYHQWQSGNVLKRLSPDWAPPRSLYSQLPERFGFNKTTEWPLMLSGDDKVRQCVDRASRKLNRAPIQLQWYRLQL